MSISRIFRGGGAVSLGFKRMSIVDAYKHKATAILTDQRASGGFGCLLKLWHIYKKDIFLFWAIAP